MKVDLPSSPLWNVYPAECETIQLGRSLFLRGQRKAKKHLSQRSLRLCGENYCPFRVNIKPPVLRVVIDIRASLLRHRLSFHTLSNTLRIDTTLGSLPGITCLQLEKISWAFCQNLISSITYQDHVFQFNHSNILIHHVHIQSNHMLFRHSRIIVRRENRGLIQF